MFKVTIFVLFKETVWLNSDHRGQSLSFRVLEKSAEMEGNQCGAYCLSMAHGGSRHSSNKEIRNKDRANPLG